MFLCVSHHSTPCSYQSKYTGLFSRYFHMCIISTISVSHILIDTVIVNTPHILDIRWRCDNMQKKKHLFFSSRLTTWVTTSLTRGHLKMDAQCVTRTSDHSQLLRSVQWQLTSVLTIIINVFCSIKKNPNRLPNLLPFPFELEYDACFFFPTGK